MLQPTRPMHLAGLLLTLGCWSVARAAVAVPESPPFCADRPGLTTPTCTLAPGTLMIEFGSVDWTGDHTADGHAETLTVGDLRVRVGLSDALELQVGLPMVRSVHLGGPSTAVRRQSTGSGDLVLALRHSLTYRHGTGPAMAVMPWVTLPTGTGGMGSGLWTGGLMFPFSQDFASGLTLSLTPEADLLANDSGHGHHLTYGTVVGVSGALSGNLGFAAELSAFRHQDPTGSTQQYLAGLSANWQATQEVQLDLGLNVGLNRQATDTEIYSGLAMRF